MADLTAEQWGAIYDQQGGSGGATPPRTPEDWGAIYDQQNRGAPTSQNSYQQLFAGSLPLAAQAAIGAYELGPRGTAQRVYDLAGSALGGLTGNFGDNITAGIGSLLGRDYNQELASQRKDLGQFEEQHPYMDMAAKIGAGVAPALLAPEAYAGNTISKGSQFLYGLPKIAGEIAPGATSQIARSLLQGGAIGGLYGAGAADSGNQLGGALRGALFGGALGGGASVISNLVASYGAPAVDAAVQAVQTMMGERGSITPASNMIDEVAALLGKRAAQVPVSQLKQAATETAAAQAAGQPMAITEAVPRAGLTQFGDYLGQSPASSPVVAQALETRQAGIPDRLKGSMSEMGQDLSPFTAGQNLQKAAEGTKSNLNRQLAEKFAPQYEEALSAAPTLDETAVQTFDKWKDGSSYVRDAVNKATKGLPEKGALTTKDTQLLQDSLSRLKATVREARDITSVDKGDLTKAMGALEEILPQPIKDVNAKYAPAKEELKNLTGGAISQLSKAKEGSFSNAANTLLKLAPEQADRVIEAFGKENQEVLKTAIRGHFKDLIDSGNLTWMKNLSKNSKEAEVLKKFVGKDIGDQFITFAKREDLMRDAGRRVMFGSQTASRGEEAKGVEELATGVLGGSWPSKIRAMAEYFIPKGSDQAKSEMARRIFQDPQEGLKMLQELIPVIEQTQRMGRYANTGSRIGASGGAIEAPGIGKRNKKYG